MTNLRYFMYSGKATDCENCRNTTFNDGCTLCTDCKSNTPHGCYCVLEHKDGVERCPKFRKVRRKKESKDGYR